MTKMFIIKVSVESPYRNGEVRVGYIGNLTTLGLNNDPVQILYVGESEKKDAFDGEVVKFFTRRQALNFIDDLTKVVERVYPDTETHIEVESQTFDEIYVTNCISKPFVWTSK